MKNDRAAIPTDIGELARDAQASMRKSSNGKSDHAPTGNAGLAADLDRVRGVAVARAKAANVRLRKKAFGATAFSFGFGLALGLFISRRRCVI